MLSGSSYELSLEVTNATSKIQHFSPGLCNRITNYPITI